MMNGAPAGAPGRLCSRPGSPVAPAFQLGHHVGGHGEDGTGVSSAEVTPVHTTKRPRPWQAGGHWSTLVDLQGPCVRPYGVHASTERH